jgi:hypothetical protein
MPEHQLSREQLIDSIKAKVKIGEGNLRSAGVQLQEARRRLPEFGLTWSAFIGECGLEKSRAYQLIAIVEGRTTEDQERAKAAERSAKFAAKNRAARNSVENGKSADPRISMIVKILRGAGPPELALWEAFACERIIERERAGDIAA